MFRYGYSLLRFGQCLDENEVRLNRSEVANRTVCEDMIKEGFNFTWHEHEINFNHVALAYLSLLQVVSI